MLFLKFCSKIDVLLIRRLFILLPSYNRGLKYVQGQLSDRNVREYFYYIDHQGMLFLDDAKMKNFTSCFKEKKFLQFFFNQLRLNKTGCYKEFPYISPCGREMNYVRCDDRPVVFTNVIDDTTDQSDLFAYGHAGPLLTVPFEPERLCMFPLSGRIYHPALLRLGGVGLVKSSLGIEFSKRFVFKNGECEPPTHFIWKNVCHKLTNDLVSIIDYNKTKAP